jgi:hypothetical protein
MKNKFNLLSLALLFEVLSILSFSTQAIADTVEDHGRINVSLPKNSSKNIVTVPLDQLTLLCGDEDGCTVRLSMNNYGNSGASAHLNAPASVSTLLFLNTISNQWRTSEPSSLRGTFGNGNIEHAISLFNTCYLTDGYFKGSTPSGDKNIGLSLMFWPLSESAGCSVTFID